MMDLKVLKSALGQLEEERGIPQGKIIEAIEHALAAAYKKDYGKKGQIVRAKFDLDTGTTEFVQVKIVVDPAMIRPEEDEDEVKEKPAETKSEEGVDEDEEKLIRFNPEHHILLEDARRIKKDAEPGDEIEFPLEARDDYGRIAAQTAKQVIMQKIREAEKVAVMKEFEEREGEIVTGTVQRIERGAIFVDLGKTTGILPYEEQIRGERYRQGERIRAYLYSVDETPRGVNLRLSRTHPKFIAKLFEMEAPEIANGVVEIKAIAREPGSRTKIAVFSHDEHIDPVGACVGQRGVRVSTVMSELGGEKIDIIEWSDDPIQFIEDALSPAQVESVEVDEENKQATVQVAEDQLSLAIGKGGQNVRLAAKLTGWKIDIKRADGETMAVSDGEDVDIPEVETPEMNEPIDTTGEVEEEVHEEEVIEEEIAERGGEVFDDDKDDIEGTTPEEVEEEEEEEEKRQGVNE